MTYKICCKECKTNSTALDKKTAYMVYKSHEEKGHHVTVFMRIFPQELII